METEAREESRKERSVLFECGKRSKFKLALSLSYCSSVPAVATASLSSHSSFSLFFLPSLSPPSPFTLSPSIARRFLVASSNDRSILELRGNNPALKQIGPILTRPALIKLNTTLETIVGPPLFRPFCHTLRTRKPLLKIDLDPCYARVSPLQIPLAVTAETQTPATRSRRPNVTIRVPVQISILTAISVPIFVSVRIPVLCRLNEAHLVSVLPDILLGLIVEDIVEGIVDTGGNDIVVDGYGSFIFLYSNARRIRAGIRLTGGKSLILSRLGRRRRRPAVLRPRCRGRDAVLHVMSQSRRQGPGVQLVKLD